MKTASPWLDFYDSAVIKVCAVLFAVNMEMISAKELLVLAQTADEQKQWVVYLSKKIIRKEPKIKSPSVR